MTPDLPANDMEGVGGAEASGSSGATGAEVPVEPHPARRTLPPGSSGKHPLPGPWPQRSASQPIAPATPPTPPTPAIPVTSVESAPVPPASPMTSVVRADTKPPVPDAGAGDGPVVPTVTPEHWLPEPTYWLADHQRIPRPATRPLTRPQRFRRMSRAQSATIALAILIVVVVLGAGMVAAGHLSYQFFNAPRSVPTIHPADVTPTLPATKKP